MDVFSVMGLNSLSVPSKAQVTWTKQNKFGSVSKIVTGFEIKRKIGVLLDIIKDSNGTLLVLTTFKLLGWVVCVFV